MITAIDALTDDLTVGVMARMQAAIGREQKAHHARLRRIQRRYMAQIEAALGVRGPTWKPLGRKALAARLDDMARGDALAYCGVLIERRARDFRIQHATGITRVLWTNDGAVNAADAVLRLLEGEG